MGILAYRVTPHPCRYPTRWCPNPGGWSSPPTTSREARNCSGPRVTGVRLDRRPRRAYLGPDYTADYLRRATTDVAAQLQDGGMADTHDAVVTEFRTNRYHPDTHELVFTDRQAAAFDRIARHYADVTSVRTRRNTACGPASSPIPPTSTI